MADLLQVRLVDGGRHETPTGFGHGEQPWGRRRSSGLPAEDENPMKQGHEESGSAGMRIATWNVNSIKQRLDHLATFVKSAEPDVVCLQELKCIDEAFPRSEVEALGYNVV